MSVRGEVVRKIAKALLERSSKEKQELIKISQLLELLHRLYKEEKDFRGFILNPNIPKEKKLEFIKSLRERFSIGSKLDEVFDYMIEINAIPFINEIKRVYEHEVEKFLKISKALLVLTRKVDEDQVERIKKVIKEHTGKDYDFEVVEDPSLIGGFLLRTSSFVLDASVKRNLDSLLRG